LIGGLNVPNLTQLDLFPDSLESIEQYVSRRVL